MPSFISPRRKQGAGAENVLTRSHIEDLIARGGHIVIVDGDILKCDSWLHHHPGGDKVIKHMVGRDGTDEMNALHSIEARQKMSRYLIGRIDCKWQNFIPPIQGGRFQTVAEQRSPENRNTMALSRPAEDDAYNSSEDSDAGSSDFESLPLWRHNSQIHRSGPTALSSITSVSSVEFDEGQASLKIDSAPDRTQQELEADLAKYPSLEAIVQEEIVHKYRLMEAQIREERLYDCNYSAYMIELARYAFLFGMSILLLRYGWYTTSAVFLGMFWHQLVFTAHDAGHVAITHNYVLDTSLGIFVASWLGGLSLGWWKRSHNIHHIVTNSPEHDPDIELMPFFAVTQRFFGNLTSTYYDKIMPYDAFAQLVVPYQHLLYYPILMLGRFNLYVLSWDYVIMGRGPRKGIASWHRYFEMAGQFFFWTWFGYFMLWKGCPTWWSRVVFVMVSHVITAPLHVQITLSHYAMSTSDLGQAESFPQKMLRTTMDVDCPVWLDWFHGGLQFQAVHHLFPRMPRHNLRRAQKLVQLFCNETGIPYALYGFVDGNRAVVSRLKDVGRQASVLAACHKATAARGMAGVFEH